MASLKANAAVPSLHTNGNGKGKDGNRTNRPWVYVGQLTSKITKNKLEKLFSNFCKVLDIFINYQLGFASVQMDTLTGAQVAIKQLDGTELNGQKIVVKLALAGTSLKIQSTEVKVENLPLVVTNERLKMAFSQFGKVEKAVIIVDDKGQPTTRGIVEFSSTISAQNAVQQIEEGCFLITSSPRPITATMMEQEDSNCGLSEEQVTKTTEYYKETKVGPRFAVLGTFEEECARTWKVRFVLERQQRQQFEENMRSSREIFQLQMEECWQQLLVQKEANEKEMLEEECTKEFEARKRIRPETPNMEINEDIDETPSKKVKFLSTVAPKNDFVEEIVDETGLVVNNKEVRRYLPKEERFYKSKGHRKAPESHEKADNKEGGMETNESDVPSSNGKKWYVCPQCPEKFEKKSIYTDHILDHTGERPHKCQTCDEEFKYQRLLRRHIRYEKCGNETKNFNETRIMREKTPVKKNTNNSMTKLDGFIKLKSSSNDEEEEEEIITIHDSGESESSDSDEISRDGQKSIIISPQIELTVSDANCNEQNVVTYKGNSLPRKSIRERVKFCGEATEEEMTTNEIDDAEGGLQVALISNNVAGESDDEDCEDTSCNPCTYVCRNGLEAMQSYFSGTDGEERAKSFLQCHDVIPTQRRCPKCQRLCRYEMKNQRFRCDRTDSSGARCRFTITDRKNTFLEKLSMTYKEMLTFLFIFVSRGNFGHNMIERELKWSRNTITAWTVYLGKVCEHFVEKQPPIGGPDTTVQLDEIFVCKRKDGGLFREFWLLGGTELDSDRKFFYHFEGQPRSCDNLIAIIQKFVTPGGSVITNSNPAFNRLEELGYINVTTNLGIQTAERLWGDLKENLKTRVNFMKFYLCRYILIRSFEKGEARMHQFLQSAASLYPIS